MSYDVEVAGGFGIFIPGERSWEVGDFELDGNMEKYDLLTTHFAVYGDADTGGGVFVERSFKKTEEGEAFVFPTVGGFVPTDEESDQLVAFAEEFGCAPETSFVVVCSWE